MGVLTADVPTGLVRANLAAACPEMLRNRVGEYDCSTLYSVATTITRSSSRKVMGTSLFGFR
jgi:hypothetical protein